MNDKELLTFAAKAAGLEPFDAWGTSFVKGDGSSPRPTWNPLTDDGDALRLALKCGISIDMNDGSAWVRSSAGCLIQEYWGGDFDPCHRRAIVRAAAEIGKAMP